MKDGSRKTPTISIGGSTTGSTPPTATSTCGSKAISSKSRHTGRGEWGVTHDDAGRIFRNTNEEALHVDLVRRRTTRAIPTWRARVAATKNSRRVERCGVADPSEAGTNRAYQKGIDRPDGTLAKFTAVCALNDRGDRLPAELNGNAFVAEPAANVVSLIAPERRRRRCSGTEGVRARGVHRVHG